jgi:hypothetical protein
MVLLKKYLNHQLLERVVVLARMAFSGLPQFLLIRHVNMKLLEDQMKHVEVHLRENLPHVLLLIQ